MSSWWLCSIDLMISTKDRTVQFTAILGDLKHKEDVYVYFQAFGPEVERYLSNSSQANFVRKVYPDLVPVPSSLDQPPSDHTLGTIFEYHYYSDITFRFRYLKVLRHKPSSLL